MKRSHSDAKRSDGRGDSHAERAVRKKIAKLKECTLDIKKELDEIESKYKRAKKAVREEADAQKAEFLQQAAALQRRVDDDGQELQKQ